VHAGVRPGKDKPKPLPADWTLEWLVFEGLRCDPTRARVRDLTDLQPGELTPQQMRDEALNPWTTVARIRELYTMVGHLGYESAVVPGEKDGEELLAALLGRTGAARAKARAALAEDDGWLDAIHGASGPEDEARIRAQMAESFGDTPDSDPRLMGLREALGEHVRQLAAVGGERQDVPAARKLAAA
jgi:hypothetical protein